MSQEGNKDRQIVKSNKFRTPSGRSLQNFVKQKRTIFSPEFVSEEVPGNVDSQYPTNREIIRASYTACEANTVQSSVKALRLSGSRPKQAVDYSSDEDSTFATPPATPARRSRVPINTFKFKDIMDQSTDQEHQDAQEVFKNETQLKQHQSKIEPMRGTITSELEKMMTDHDEETDGPQYIGIKSVHAMFKKLENKFDERMQQFIEGESTRQIKHTLYNMDDSQEEIEELELINEKFKQMELKHKALRSTVLKIYDQTSEGMERLNKLEISNNKKLITLSGLYTKSTKEEAIKEIEAFIEVELELPIKIEDCFEIGSSTPRLKVIVLQSLADKRAIFERKKMLKDVRNADDKPYYISEYYNSASNEVRKRKKEILNRNSTLPQEKQADLKIEQGQLLLDGNPFEFPLEPPSPDKLLDLSTDKLDQILKLPVCKGSSIEDEGNIFTGFTLAVDNKQQIEDAYLKMRLCYPRARHIIAAYILQGDEYHYQRGGCDDGEHGSSNQLLEWMIDNNLECRIIFVVRYYNGKKIGPTRFRRILEAAVECIETYPNNKILDTQQILAKQSGNIQQEENKQENTAQKSVQYFLSKAKQMKSTYRSVSSSRGRGRRGRQQYNNHHQHQNNLQPNQENKRKGSPLSHENDTYTKRKSQHRSSENGVNEGSSASNL